MSYFSHDFLFSVFSGVATDTRPQDLQIKDQLDALQDMCSKTAKEREERQSNSSLYKRLGGYEKIIALTREIVRLHNQNESIQHYFSSIDSENLARHVADFMAAGTGGTVEYRGRSMVDAHRDMKLSDADFLSAGGDVIQAMENQGYKQEEIDEVVCILMSLKDQVVLE